ncbi:MAG TPA: hypothetical protein VMU95_16970 [Trebonia sp.]|nr:hypothetical protein [Trebonia sp.]
MRLRHRRRNVVVFRSSARPASGYDAWRQSRLARTGRIRRCIRIGALLTVIAVRPRWRPLLAGMVFAVVGIVERDGPIGVVIVPGILLLWQSLLIPANPDADRERRAQLERELAAFSTPAQRCDLEATLDRYPDPITGEIRDILGRQVAAARTTGIPGAGRH